MPTVIKSEQDYAAALTEIERLIDLGPSPGTSEADQLELLTLLVQNYEAEEFPRQCPNPIDAIVFRMEQQNLAPRDLIPYIGSRSKVSEILSGKRSLTLSMIRSLHEGLGIPAKALIQQNETEDEGDTPDWTLFPVREMIKRGWIKDSLHAVEEFFSQLPSSKRACVLYRKGDHIRSARNMDVHALAAWTTQIIIRARQADLSSTYRPGTVTLQFMRDLAKCSVSDHGPIAARRFLSEHGIPLIIEPHLPHTFLDGAAILLFANMPIVAMSVRHDRLDNFWFTLMHEVAHIALHSAGNDTQFIDDLDVEANNDPKEREADSLAGEALIPKLAWEKSAASRLRSPEAAQQLARTLGINPAIVAGRMRHEWKAFRLLNNWVGHHSVRREFPDIKWPD